MSIGQEGDTRQYRRLKRTDYYASKSAFDQKQIKKYPKCKGCGQDITGHNWSGYCLRCHRA